MTIEALVLDRHGSRAEIQTRRVRPAAARRTTSVVLADDRAIRRAALAAWIGADACIEIVAQASTPEEAAALIVDAQPNVLLMHCEGPNDPFLPVASRIPRLSERTQVVLLSTDHNERSCRAAASCGGSAHISMHDSPDELIAAIRGRSPSQPSRCAIEPDAPVRPALSNRERDVLIRLAQGLSAKQAAAALGICPKTVDNHAQRLMRKLDLHSRADVVLFAVREGYITP